jgi:hypothetical protein
LQSVAVCCSALHQSVAVCCSALRTNSACTPPLLYRSPGQGLVCVRGQGERESERARERESERARERESERPRERESEDERETERESPFQDRLWPQLEHVLEQPQSEWPLSTHL